jgi:hypothetical protein
MAFWSSGGVHLGHISVIEKPRILGQNYTNRIMLIKYSDLPCQLHCSNSSPTFCTCTSYESIIKSWGMAYWTASISRFGARNNSTNGKRKPNTLPRNLRMNSFRRHYPSVPTKREEISHPDMLPERMRAQESGPWIAMGKLEGSTNLLLVDLEGITIHHVEL